LDESTGPLEWKKGALYFSALQRTASHLFAIDPASGSLKRTAQVKGWTLGKREVIRWNSVDGTEIEGVLIKPHEHQITFGRQSTSVSP